MSRGKLSEKVKSKSKELMKEEITRTELRLMPYIQYKGFVISLALHSC